MSATVQITIIFTVFLAVCLISSYYVQQKPTFNEEDDVIVLNEKIFQKAVDAFPYLMVEFYAPWCQHCKQLAPEYSKAAKQLKANNPQIILAKIDSTANQALAQKFSVQSYPTLRFFINQTDIEYKGGRTEKDIIGWINNKTLDVTTEINNNEQFQHMQQTNQLLMVYFGTSNQDSALPIFKIIAKEYDDIPFIYTFQASFREQYKAKSNSIVLFKQFDEKRNDLEGKISGSSIRQFIDKYSFADLMPFDSRTIDKIFTKQNNALFIISDDSAKSKTAEILVSQVAKTNKGKLLFCLSKSSDEKFTTLLEYMGLNQSQLPAIMIIQFIGKELNKFKYEEADITKQNLDKFIANFQKGRLLKYIKSEPIPVKNDDAVKIVVAKNFDDLVIKNQADVLIEFYAPWCGHCKALAPEYQALAESLKKNTNLVIAKCDATANEIPGVEIKSFPTLKFYPKGKKNSPIEFNGERNQAGIYKWLKEKTSYPWVEADKKSDL